MSARSALQFEMLAEIVTITLALAITLPLGGCHENSEKGEAANLVRVITDLRMADNDHKQAPLDQLRALPCTADDVCEARNLCVQAFDHHVKGLRLGARLRKRLGDAGSAEAGPDEDATALLLEMNLEVEEGRKAMPDCEQRVASLRRKHRL